jgi:hypothetical protein
LRKHPAQSQGANELFTRTLFNRSSMFPPG